MTNTPEGVRSIVRALEPYHAWVKVLVAIDLIGWAAFELWAHLEVASGYGWTHEGWWNARTSVWLTLLPFDNLLISWWHWDLANKQHRLTETTRSDVNRPFAVIDRQRGPEAERAPGEHARYVLRNIGTGLAVNVFHVVEDDAGLAIRSLGALAGRTERALPESLEQPLRDARGAAHQFVIVSEALASHPGRWTVTANVLLSTGEVAHRVVWLESEKRSDSLRAWLDWHWSVVKTQMAVLENQR